MMARSGRPPLFFRRPLARLLLALPGLAALSGLPRAEIPLDKRVSSYAQMGAETRKMQDDDTANPAMLWVLDGEALWRTKAGSSGRACADCHGEAATSMKGVAARYPAFDPTRNEAVNLEGRINACRTGQQGAEAFAYESRELLSVTVYIARGSRGAPIEITDPRLQTTIARGREMFTQRQGQLNLSCANCHDDNWGQKLAGNVVPQGHPTGYPLYRLEWQTVGSLQRRLRNCMTGMRAAPYALGSQDLVALETYLLWRARGLPLDDHTCRRDCGGDRPSQC